MSVPTGVFDRPDFADDTEHEQVVFCRDTATGLRAIIAIHSTALGPALGGTRFYPYVDEQAALTDVLRLSRGMTYKAAVAGLALGGGKAVILGDPTTVKTPELLRAFGRYVDTLGGRYITAGDVGTSAADMDIVGTATAHVVARSQHAGGSGDSAPMTALGVFRAMQAASESIWGSEGVAGRVVGVEGVGKVGYELAQLLVSAGATVLATDVSADALRRLTEQVPGVRTTATLADTELDVYAPCAMGATLSPATVASLRCGLICGAANNQLATTDVEHLLYERGIVWVPDFVANSGGLIQVAGEIDNRTREHVIEQVNGIGDVVATILARAQSSGALAGAAALSLARARLTGARP